MIFLLTSISFSQFDLPAGSSSVRFPVAQSTSISSFFAGELAKIQDLWLLDPSNKTWKYYSPNTQSQHYTDFTSFSSIEPNQSYIIKLTSALSLNTPFTFSSVDPANIKTGLQLINLEDSLTNLTSITSSNINTRVHSIYSLWNSKWYRHFHQPSTAMLKIQSSSSIQALTTLTKQAAYFLNFAPNMTKLSIDRVVNFSSIQSNNKVIVGSSINNSGIPTGSVSYLGLNTSTSNGYWYADIYYPTNTKNIYLDFIQNHTISDKVHNYSAINLNQTKKNHINLSPANSLISLFQSKNKGISTSEVASFILSPLVLNNNDLLNQKHYDPLKIDINSNSFTGAAFTQSETTVAGLALQSMNEILSNTVNSNDIEILKQVKTSFQNLSTVNANIAAFSNLIFHKLSSLNSNVSLQSKFNSLNALDSQNLNLSFSNQTIKTDKSWLSSHRFYVGNIASKISKIENQTAFLTPVDPLKNYQFTAYPNSIKFSISPFQDQLTTSTKLEVRLQSVSSAQHFISVTADHLTIERNAEGQIFTGIKKDVPFTVEIKTSISAKIDSLNETFDINDYLIGDSTFIEVPIKNYIDKGKSSTITTNAINSFEGQNNNLTITLSDLYFSLHNINSLKFNKIKIENLRIN